MRLQVGVGRIGSAEIKNDEVAAQIRQCLRKRVRLRLSRIIGHVSLTAATSASATASTFGALAAITVDIFRTAMEHLAVVEPLHKIDCEALRHNVAPLERQHAGDVMIDAA
jgi:hypothetical protein